MHAHAAKVLTNSTCEET